MRTINTQINFTLILEKARNALIIITNRVLAAFSKYRIGTPRKTPIQELLFSLCGNDPIAYKITLRWLAYPLQFVNKPISTARQLKQPPLFVCGDQDSGQSWFFSKIMAEIYGEGFRDRTNCMLESLLNDWVIGAKFVVIDGVGDDDEVEKLVDRFNQRVITVHRKGQPSKLHSNKMSVVIIANSTPPVLPNHCIPICAAKPESATLFAEVADDIKSGGIERFKQFLLTV